MSNPGIPRPLTDGIAGSVSFAMPMACLSLLHFRLLLATSRQYPMINLNVNLALPEDIIRMVLEDKAGFGVVVKKRIIRT
ncbi:MAG: hypothetical protein P8163_14845 [Candidatus Thiodiazotropha sp.]